MAFEKLPRRNQEPFEHRTLVGYSDTPGEPVQMAEQYTAKGTLIQWSQHPYTRTDAWQQTPIRRAIITAGDNIYYLRGNLFLDIKATREKDELIGVPISFRTPLPDVIIGKPAAFSAGEPVKEVLIATERVSQQQRKRPGRGYKVKTGDPFKQFEALLEHHMPDGKPRIHKKDDDLDRVEVEHPSYSQSLRFIDPRFYQISDETRKAARPFGDDDRPVTLGYAPAHEVEEVRNTEYVASEYGVKMSPRSTEFTSHRENNKQEYMPRLSTDIANSIKEDVRGIRDQLSKQAREAPIMRGAIKKARQIKTDRAKKNDGKHHQKF